MYKRLCISSWKCQVLTQLLSYYSASFVTIYLINMYIAGFEAIDASLSVITSTSCPRFHADHVELRCLCTYSGEGTYFVPNAAVDRRRWMRALGIHDTNGFGVKSERHIHQAAEWDIVVLKGNAFPGNEGESKAKYACMPAVNCLLQAIWLHTHPGCIHT